MKPELIEEIVEIPKICYALGGVGILTVIYSFIALRNPFFVITGLFGGFTFLYLSYDQWFKRMSDKKINHLSERLDSISTELYSREVLK